MNLQKEIEVLINRVSRENESNTPDFILAQYLMDCLKAGEFLINSREKWHKTGELRNSG